MQFDGETMKETYRANYDDYRTRYGAPWYFSHRVDLHRELKRLALQKKERSRGASLNLSATVTYADCENGILTFADGTAIRKDVIIGADGVHVRPFLPTNLLRRKPSSDLLLSPSLRNLS